MKDTLAVSNEHGFEIAFNMITFQRIHNELRKDYLSISDAVSKLSLTDTAYKPMLRACIKELFTLIEADIYLYNQYNPYPNYDDGHGLRDKFKKTLKHHGKTFKRSQDVIEFNSSFIRLFISLREKRDSFTHPRGQSCIEVCNADLDIANTFYKAYTHHINNLMTNTSISFQIPISQLLNHS